AIDVVNRQRAARSKQPADCGHYPTWLHYAYLQEHRVQEAQKALDACRQSAFTSKFVSAGMMDTLPGRIESYAEMRANQLASGVVLAPTEAVAVPEGADHASARFTLAYGDVLAAARRGDAEALKAATARLHDLRTAERS